MTPLLGEIRMFAGNFAPQDWAFCDGQLLSIAANDALFALIGTTYGGDGITSFALPDLRGRIPIHAGFTHVLGEMGGSEDMTLTSNQIPAHTHLLGASGKAGNRRSPLGAWPAVDGAGVATLYSSNIPNAAANWPVAASTGGSQPHDNMQPYLCVNFIISLFGVFPTQD